MFTCVSVSDFPVGYTNTGSIRKSSSGSQKSVFILHLRREQFNNQIFRRPVWTEIGKTVHLPMHIINADFRFLVRDFPSNIFLPSIVWKLFVTLAAYGT